MKFSVLKSSFVVLIMSMLIASVGTAAPTLTVVDNGLNGSSNREWEVFIAPDATLFSGGQGSIATELAFEVTTGSLVSASTNTTLWPANNPGNNPFTSGTTFGVDVNTTNSTVFAALGSDLFTSSTPASILTIETAGAGATTLSWGGHTLLPGSSFQFVGSRIAQDAANFDNYMGSLSVSGGLICDADSDGDCDQDDINALYTQIGSAGSMDLDNSGSVTPDDIAPWLTAASDPANPYKTNSGGTTADTYIVGDADLNGDVDSTDLGLLLNNFSSTTMETWKNGNLNGDANVDSTDLGLLLNNFSFTSAASVSAVPEPNSIGLLLMAFFGLAIRARRRR